MRLGLVSGSVAVALTCMLIAAMTDQKRLRVTGRAESAFRIAALLLLVCVPLLALAGAGTPSLLSTSALGVAAVGAIALTVLGRRWVGPAPEVASPNLPFALGAARIEAVHPARAETAADTSIARTAQLPVPVLLVAVTDDGHRIELNQN